MYKLWNLQKSFEHLEQKITFIAYTFPKLNVKREL